MHNTNGIFILVLTALKLQNFLIKPSYCSSFFTAHNVVQLRVRQWEQHMAKRLLAACGSSLSLPTVLLLLFFGTSVSRKKSAARNNSLSSRELLCVSLPEEPLNSISVRVCARERSNVVSALAPKVARGMQTSGKTRGATQIQIKFAPASN